MPDWTTRVSRLCCLFLLLASLLGALARAADLELAVSGDQQVRVLEAAASGGESVALRLPGEAGVASWPLGQEPWAPGLYEARLRWRWLLPTNYDHGRLRVELRVLSGQTLVGSQRVHFGHLDTTPGAYTTLSVTVSLPRAGKLRLELAWSVMALAAGQPARPVEILAAPPITEDAGARLTAPSAAEQALIDQAASRLLNERARPLAELDFPAILLDTVSLVPLATEVAVTRVWPAKVHVYPGEANPVTVTVANWGATPWQGSLRLRLLTGLNDESWTATVPLTLAAGAQAEQRFDWPGGAREYGTEARAELLDAQGQVRHAASEVFSTSTPIWKTAIQGSGFITWYGREDQFEPHVQANRRAYVNVEEAFSWQPSSWDDLTPEGDDWWTGQNNFHNSRRGLEIWMAANHREGIKMITYIWPTASGPAGVETARRVPEGITHEAIGLSSEFHDVEDLRLYELTRRQPSLWRHHYGVWHAFGVSRGHLKAIDLAVKELIASARQFGWDGVRFDAPLTWSGMEAVHALAELERLGVKDLMGQLMPDLLTTREGAWSGEQISRRNYQYARHQLRAALGPHYAISSNFGRDLAELGPVVKEAASAGGQIMHEGIRQSTSWAAYAHTCRTQAELIRQTEGYHTVCALNLAGALDASYASIHTFASGSHPYLTGGYALAPSAGNSYGQFMTRYGEYCWSRDLAPAEAATLGLRVTASGPLDWPAWLRQRTLADGTRELVQHLITPPPSDQIGAERPAWPRPWLKSVQVTLPGTGPVPEVWRLSAEPTVQAERLPVTQSAEGFTVTVAEHHFWTMLIWRTPGVAK